MEKTFLIVLGIGAGIVVVIFVSKMARVAFLARRGFRSAKWQINNCDFDGAVAEYDTLIERFPKAALPHCLRGYALGKKGEYGAAMAEFDVAINLEPRSAETYLHRGMVKESKGDLKEAVHDFDRAIELKPAYSRAFLLKSERQS